MPRPALTYPVSLEPLSDFYALSPWSLAEMARRFGLGRSNLMGLLRGDRTISNARLEELLRWSGLEVVDGTLRLAPGLHVWRIASDHHLEAFARLPEKLRPEDAWELVTEADHPRREWIHVRSRSRDARQVLLSVRPDYYPLLRDRWPALGRHERLYRFADGKTYDGIANNLGGKQLYIPAAESAQLFMNTDAKKIKSDPEIDAWARWLRQSLHIDTESWLLPELAAEEPQGEGSGTSAASVHPEACQRAWAVLSHRLDLGDAHSDLCDVPVFSLGEVHQYPKGMVRLDRSFLDEKAMEYAKAQRLRFYMDENTVVMWLVVMNGQSPCGLPDTSSSDRIGDFALMLDGESLRVDRINPPGQNILGWVLSRMEGVGNPSSPIPPRSEGHDISHRRIDGEKPQ